MKKTACAGVMGVAFLLMHACSPYLPDPTDPTAVADYLCDKTKEMTELLKEPEIQDRKIKRRRKELRAFKTTLKQTHGDQLTVFMDSVRIRIDQNCPIPVPDK